MEAHLNIHTSFDLLDSSLRIDFFLQAEDGIRDSAK